MKRLSSDGTYLREHDLETDAHNKLNDESFIIKGCLYQVFFCVKVNESQIFTTKEDNTTAHNFKRDKVLHLCAHTHTR